MNQEEWKEIKEKIRQNKHFGDKHPWLRKIRKSILLFSLVIVPLLPLVLTENFVATSALCQWFIGIMSSWVPGIEIISHASAIPNITSLAVSFAWIGIFLLFFITLIFLLESETDDCFVFFPKITKFLIFMYLGGLLFLLMEFDLIGHFSFYHGTIGVFDPDSKRNIPNMLIQSKIGLGFFIWFEIIWVVGIIIGWLMVNLQLFKNIAVKIR
ncbi:hypothetical protein [Sulfuricurvum sp.]|uniref:hypothetical protein n=1 Tax=Sulfuricurvum sp. TaxID=2025608 RepID=UPI002D3355AF|nr:hypothetical protein [Sulfuricurvum sp.]HZF70399.1 hypothetical protein [Sulfuricurvum sp.]